MAPGYQTITIPNSENTSVRILQLSSPDLSSLEEDPWGHRVMDPSGVNMEIGLDMGVGMGMQMGDGMDVFDHNSIFESDRGLLDNMPSLPFTPTYDLDTFSSTFEDPFSYQSDAFSMLQTSIPDMRPSSTDPNNCEAKNENPDNKLLSFGLPVSDCAIFTSTGAQAWPSMTAELYGMFFVAEDVFGDSMPAADRPTELTCYRRNLFQISGNITLSRGIKSCINEQGHQLPLYDLWATLTAVESIDGKASEIISVPWKATAQSSGVPSEDKSGNAPPKIPLDLSLNPELDPNIISIPVAWKRLQFKHATANNGRRKGLQQHYVIQISLIGTLQDGESVKLAEIKSGPIVVRGRSPRNFDSRKDVNLSSAERKLEGKMKSAEPPMKVDPGVVNGSYKFYTLNTVQQPLDLADWNTQSAPPLPSPPISDAHRAKKPSLANSTTSSTSTTTTRPPVPRAMWKSDDSTTKSVASQAPVPIDPSAVDEERSASRGARSLSLDEGSPRVERVGSAGSKKGLAGSPIENADLLYEYFPLSVDDWMPPVDAIYRPHVVHHTTMPPDLKAEQVRNKTKRYFSAED